MIEILNTLITLLVTIDPPGLIPIFLSLSVGMNGKEQKQTAIIAATIAFVILAFFALVGTQIITTLGISLGAFRIAGGILLFFIAFEMIFEKRTERKEKTAAIIITKDHITNIAAFPLAMPMIAGPGVISATILMAGNNPGWSGKVITLGVLFIAVLCCYFFMRLSPAIDRLIGVAGRSIVTRLFGLLLAALAVQLVADGIKSLFFQ